MVKNMTEGKPMRVIMLFAIPLFFGNIFQQIYNMVDSIVVGKYVGATALAAVGACTGPFSLVLSLVTGLTGGMAIVIAQYFGAQNGSMVKKAFISAMAVSLAAGVLVTIVGVLVARPLLTIMGTPADIIDDANVYLVIMFIGTIANCLYNGMTGVLRALGNSVVPLVILIITSLLNVVLDLLFVLGFDLGVAGVAIATVISQLVSAIVCIIYAFMKIPELRFGWSDCKLDASVAREIIRIGVPTALSTCGVSVSVMFLQTAINAHGSTVAAAYTIGNRVEMLCMGLGFSIGLAVGTFCGQNIGARKYDRVKQGMNAGYIICLTYTIAMALVMFLGAVPLGKLFTNEAEVLFIAKNCIRILAPFVPVLGLIFIFQNFLRSAGDIAPTVWMSIAEIAARSILAFTFSALWGYYGIFFSTPVGWVATVIIGYSRYRSGKWRAKIKVE